MLEVFWFFVFSTGTRQSLIESTTFPSVSHIPSPELHIPLTQVLQLSFISHRLSPLSSCRSWVPEEKGFVHSNSLLGSLMYWHEVPNCEGNLCQTFPTRRMETSHQSSSFSPYRIRHSFLNTSISATAFQQGVGAISLPFAVDLAVLPQGLGCWNAHGQVNPLALRHTPPAPTARKDGCNLHAV